ncbi:fibrobacter succinogenes major paralogous domain-containing protein [Geofilum rubicundum]|uniref:SclB protein n=1 Tax=Geofilum rubicundum JCM 15548 TaxID=1236989 RepID=A0A0E9LZ63_9BACT|nr:fibrobacter succinogenes major paralogous domain-containing protein [Geofilum rubicundum]GAO30593.1 SclB protein [Geofilum rubicundum JCM 15548]
MVRCALGLICFLSGSWAISQPLSLDFEAEGAAAYLDEVEVMNLNSGSRVSVFNGEYLWLGGSGGDLQNDSISDMVVSPDMAAGACDIAFALARPGYVFLSISDAMGRVVVNEERELPRGQHQLRVEGLRSGAYKVSLMTPHAEHTHWIRSDARLAANKVLVVWSKQAASPQEQTKMAISWPYATGDRLLMKGMAGEMVHYVTLVPTKDSVVVFQFMPCVDGDKNAYATVEIGGRFWMAENLRTTHLVSGEELPEVRDNNDWQDLALPAYCWYQNNDHHRYQYGALYNWYAVSDAGLCPQGWRLPTDEDWLELEKVMDPAIDVTSATGWRGKDGALKMKTLRGWNGQKGTNLFGFSALPAGRRSHEGHFNSVGDYAYWWTASPRDEENAWSRYILPDYDYLYRGSFSKKYGFSVRCVRGD